MHLNPNDTKFRWCDGMRTRDHGAFNYLYRWSVRHMLLEVLVTALLIYLQFLDRSVGLWAMSAAIVSLVGASIPSFCFSNALGWRLNFAIQVIVIIIRAALVLYIIYYFATSFSDSELAAVRICQLVTIVLSSLSQSPLFHMSFKSTWLINLRPVDSNYQNRVNNNVPHGNRVHLGNEPLMASGSDGDEEARTHLKQSLKGGDLESNYDDQYGGGGGGGGGQGQERDKYGNLRDRRELEIGHIAEGNEEDDDEYNESNHGNNSNHGNGNNGNDNLPQMYSPFNKSRSKSPQRAGTGLTPLKSDIPASTVFEFANKEDLHFTHQNLMHSSRAVTQGPLGSPPTHTKTYQDSENFLYINPARDNNSSSSLESGASRPKDHPQPLDFKKTAFKAPLSMVAPRPLGSEGLSFSKPLPAIGKPLPPITAAPFLPRKVYSSDSLPSNQSSSSILSVSSLPSHSTAPSMSTGPSLLSGPIISPVRPISPVPNLPLLNFSPLRPPAPVTYATDSVPDSTGGSESNNSGDESSSSPSSREHNYNNNNVNVKIRSGNTRKQSNSNISNNYNSSTRLQPQSLSQTINTQNRYAEQYSEDDDNIDYEVSGSVKSKPNSVRMSNSNSNSARISPTPFMGTGTGLESGPGSNSASWRRSEADEYSAPEGGYTGEAVGFAPLSGRASRAGSAKYDSSSAKHRREARSGSAEIGPDGQPISFIPRKGGRVRLSIVKGQMVFSDLERSVAGDAASDNDSESENNSVQSPTNTIPPETPALSPFLTGRKGPLPNSDARSRFSPKGGRSDKKSSDFLSLDNYLEK